MNEAHDGGRSHTHPHALAQQTVIDRARTKLPDDPRVLGVFLIGSHASGENDDYSDVDLHLVIADDDAESGLSSAA